MSRPPELPAEAPAPPVNAPMTRLPALIANARRTRRSVLWSALIGLVLIALSALLLSLIHI